ncbi:hypothetical protein HYH03_008478 [Edaphochlamys debaryana]|uniref:Steroid 5-alpha reductase C-terminal domain-containing protein n=1 Tax=Edaphochlamys debaryana TaxID=47281 RepID=A0A836BY95_9CHLO|nr:hypothetical protein HYH03_008478 [Edaphochlamys debaryana]|eukprot:KAG2493345.1 hypothetical protein HYH03_008478 [Edaphochlamys debaryana]
MSHLKGASVLIPGSAWTPPQVEPAPATIIDFSRATRSYPEGRVRILCEDGTDVWWDMAKLPMDWITSLAEPATSPAAPPAARTPSRTRRSAAAAAPTPGLTPSTTTHARATARRRSVASKTAAATGDGYESTGLLSDGDGAAKATSPAAPPPPAAAAPASSGRRRSSASAVKSAIGSALLAAMSPAIAVTVTALGNSAVAKPSAITVDTDHELLSGGEGEQATTGTRQRRPRKSLRFAPGTYSPGANAAAAASATPLAPSLRAPAGAGGFTSPLTSPLISPLTSPRASGGGAHAHSFSLTASGAVAAAAEAAFASRPPQLSLARRLRNWMLIVVVCLPALYFYRQLQSGCSLAQWLGPLPSPLWSGGLEQLATADFWCAVGYQRPLLAVNLVFFLNVCVLFWLIGIAQGSTWLIDPFWQIIPVMIGLFYQHHPAAEANPLRSRLAMGLLWLWAVRLTHSYFRREEWQVGAREDWRYARMALRYGRWWPLISFFTVGVTQQAMLVGITSPLLAIHNTPAPWHPVLDPAIFLLAATGIMLALVADNQLRDFMMVNEKRAVEGREPLPVLDSGLWRYSRHPNFFGEQLWWWSLAMWGALVCGQPWMTLGAAFNTLCFVPITRMNEDRMLERRSRAEAYVRYQLTTSAWVPWFKGSE